MLHQKSVLITGGTGFLGRTLVRLVLERYPEVKRLIVFSRDELKQYEMAQDFPEQTYPSLTYVLGDVRDHERVQQACAGVDYIIHAAALKQVPTAERNPMEYVKTNILGTENVIRAALASGVERVVALSTDKAVAPLGVYGATKLCAERLVIAANSLEGDRKTKLSVVRFGNILGSYGSVLPFFLKKKEEGMIPITDERMTRFSMLSQEAAEMVLWVLNTMWGGEIYVPKLPSYRVVELAEAVAPDCPKKLAGARPGEKIHEELVSEAESATTYDLGKYYAILPLQPVWDIDAYIRQQGVKQVPEGFCYTSDTNINYLNMHDLNSSISDINKNYTNI